MLRTTTLEINRSRLALDLGHTSKFQTRREDYWKERKSEFISPSIFKENSSIHLEIGSGTGGFFMELAQKRPENFYIAIERCKTRGKALVKKTDKSGLQNIKGYRANAVPALIHGIPDNSVDRLYILYPCPWPKMSQRKNRWYLHTVMPHFLRILKPGGHFIWASDQKFYIDEAAYVCKEHYKLEILAHGEIAPNPYNDFDLFPTGRTKFERDFLGRGLPCFELIVTKS